MTTSGTRRNIVLVACDQWAAGAVGCYGAPLPDVTPDIDAWAATGTRFDRYFASTPVCGPNRATMFTGRSPSVHGVYFNNMELTGDTPLFTNVLQEAGYRTFGVGKFHFSAMHHPPPGRDGFRHLGFDEALVTEDPKHGAWLDWIRDEHPDHYDHALAVSWPMPYLATAGPGGTDLTGAWRAAYEKWADYLRPDGYFPFFDSPLPAELHQTTWITDQALAELDRHRGRDDGTPLFMYVSYVDPHDPYDPPAPYNRLYDWRDVPPPVPQEWDRDFCADDYVDFQDNSPFTVLRYSEETWGGLRRNYFGSCRFLNDQIARLLRAVAEARPGEETVVVFTTDHGDMIGDHGFLAKGPFLYDKCIRCPLIVVGPGVAPGVVTDTLTCSLDLFPLITGLAGLPAGVPLEGRDPLASPEEGPEPDEVGIELLHRKRRQARGIVTDDGWRLSLFPGQAYGELFNLVEDPLEQHNRFRDPAVQGLRLELAERLVFAQSRQPFPFPVRGQADGIDYEGAGFAVKRSYRPVSA